MKAPFLLLPFFAQTLFGALPFTTEEFNTEINTTQWSIFDYQTGALTDPDWNAVDGGPNPEASTVFTVGNGVSFVADQDSSLGTFTGDYLSAGIEGIDCDIYSEDATVILSVEFYFLHDEVYYYSDPFSLNRNGWSILQYSFRAEPWYYIDEDNFFVEVEITDEILSEIVEIGVDFFPVEGNSAIGSRVAVDNFTLVGQVPMTSLGIESGSEITLSFPREEGFSYTIETNDDLASAGWSELSEETTDITGTETFEITIPRSDRQFLRLLTRPVYYAVPDIELKKGAESKKILRQSPLSGLSHRR